MSEQRDDKSRPSLVERLRTWAEVSSNEPHLQRILREAADALPSTPSHVGQITEQQAWEDFDEAYVAKFGTINSADAVYISMRSSWAAAAARYPASSTTRRSEPGFDDLIANEVERFVYGQGSGRITGTMDRRRWDAIVTALRRKVTTEQLERELAEARNDALLLEEANQRLLDPEVKAASAASAIVPKDFAERCWPAVRSWLNKAERSVNDFNAGRTTYPPHYKTILELDADRARKLLDEIEGISGINRADGTTDHRMLGGSE